MKRLLALGLAVTGVWVVCVADANERTARRFGAIAAEAGLSAPAAPGEARVWRVACDWRWLCDERGKCKRIYDCPEDRKEGLHIIPPRITPIDPPSIAPIVPHSTKPMVPPTIAPLGKKSCDQRRICDDFGNCKWERICE